jgi:alkylhydroperoxidase/carboxymuconolactone decarboxylase family protein YurZ
MLIALNRPTEFKLHIRAAIHNGVSINEIRELIMHSTVYCGFPAANESFKIAENSIVEMGLDIKEKKNPGHA